METAFGIHSRRSLDILTEESNIRWPAPESKTTSRFNRASTTIAPSSSSSITTTMANGKVMTPVERKAWVKRKKADDSWIENPTDKDHARMAKERVRKQREWEAERKRKAQGGQWGPGEMRP